ncbi:MAG: SpoIIE family protein phosphatase, partial [Myxococcota bacterium]
MVLASELSGKDSVFRNASAAMALPGNTINQGFLVVYGLVPTSLFEQPIRAELDAVVGLFSVALGQIRRQETLQRSHQRAVAKLDEFQEAQDILFLGDREEILTAVLGRALRNLGALQGCIVLGEPGDWELAQEQGRIQQDDPVVKEMVAECFGRKSPGLINSLSGEQTWSFDIDTIHMATMVAFPLLGRGRCIGVLLATDATVSLDNIEMVQATTRAGATAIENWEIRQATLRQQRLQEQMDLAAKAQQRLLPARDPDFRGLRLNHFSLYCDETGGDYVDAFTYEKEGSFGSLLIGDVAGHGLGAAMLMVDLRARLRTMLRLENPWAPHKVLRTASQVLKEDSAPEEFVTLFLATVDARTGVMRYANAGHEPPLLFKRRQNRWIELESTGVPLGLVADSQYEVQALNLEPGDVLIAMTDGVTEAQATDGKVFGTESIRRSIEAMGEATPTRMMEAVVAETVRHRDRQAFNDDLTYLIAVVEDVGLQLLDTPPLLSGELVWEVRFPATAEDKDVRLRELGHILGSRFPGHDLDALYLSCEEAMSNAVLHGNRNDGTKQVTVRMVHDVEHAELHVFVRDQGDGFDPRASVLEHFDEGSLHRVSGRGLVKVFEDTRSGVEPVALVS